MLWDRKDREKLPPELRDLTPEQLAEKLKTASDAEARLTDAEKARQERDQAFDSLKNEFEQTKQRLATIEANTKPPEKEVSSIFADPDAYIRDSTKDTRDVALLSGMMSAKMYCRQNLTGRDVRIFAKYEGEIDKIVGSYAPEFRIMPQTWMNALIYTKGLHDKEIQRAEEERTDFFSETPSNAQYEQTLRGDKLTPDEAELCKKFHWDPAKYLENKKKSTLVGDHVSFKG
jgi:hypothetical protein